ncbi:hypothetical protein SIPHO049v1_p0078 [Vibrio phage PS14A.1]|nr:hypothetical protein SIPHO049v1_p0078 [Vibrio phage PS14A.1]
MFIIDQKLVDALDQRVVEPIYFVFIDWPDNPVYAHTGIGPINYDGKIWHGVGYLGGIGAVECNANVGAHTVNLQLSGIDPLVLREVTTNHVVNRDVELHYGAIDEKGQLIAASPYFYGRVSTTSIIRYDKDAVTVQAVSKTSDWGRSRPDRYNDESHRSKHPSDDFFQYIAQMSQRDLYWGSDKESIPLKPREQQT